eukprot:275986-Rhodomonas_salina.1
MARTMTLTAPEVTFMAPIVIFTAPNADVLMACVVCGLWSVREAKRAKSDLQRLHSALASTKTQVSPSPVSYTHLRAHETEADL